MSATELRFDLSGVGVAVRGLTSTFAARLAEDWEAYRAEDGAAFLDIEVATTGAPTGGVRFDPKSMKIELGPDRVRYAMDGGHVEIDSQGQGRLLLRGADGEAAYWTFMNLLRAALAWQMPSRGGALLHAAAVVLESTAWALAGPEGSGKSTWASLAAREGALVIGEDVVLIEAAADGFEVLGLPLHPKLDRSCPPGRWPLRAVLFPAKGREPRLEPVGRLEAAARVLANLPFVAEIHDRDPRVRQVIDTLLEATPMRRLTFAPDGRFVEILRRGL